MQQEVGNFDFDKHYARGTGDIRFSTKDEENKIIFLEDKTVSDQINITTHVYTHRALNFTLAHYRFLPDDVNPNLILRFDCRQINDIMTFRMSETKREHWIVVACGDGYLRVFNAA